MAKRRTRYEKVKAKSNGGYKINFESIKTKVIPKKERVDVSEVELLKKDLTKVMAVSMLAVGSELALWWFLFR